MIPDDLSSLDDALLAELLNADAALAEGREPWRDDPAETVDTLPIEGLSDYIGLLKRLGRHGATAVPTPGGIAGLRLGRFEILGTLGQGGFGIVYLARDPTLGRRVALKVPRPEVLIGPDVRRRFLREARAAAGLNHPNLVTVYEAGEVDALCYIASAYCLGLALSRWLKARTEPVRPEVAARLIAALADAVQHAHDRGILHRDIKPSNIILSDGRGEEPGDEARDGSGSIRLPDELDPFPRLTDFGLARIADEVGEETRTGVALGSPPYMAPEQAAGKNRDVGAATDVYALGATLYEVLTGRPPFRGETATETLRMVLEADCVAPRVLRPGLSRDLETICLKCLAKEPAGRYPTAAALAEDLRRYLSHEPILARPGTIRQQVRKWVRRRPFHAAFAALAAVLGVVVLAGLVHRNALVQAHARALERQVDRADAGERLARRHLMAFQLRQASDALDANRVERTQSILRDAQVDGPGFPALPERQGFAWNYLMAQASRDVVVLSDRRGERVSEVAPSPDGRILATGDEDGTIRLRDPGTGRVHATLVGHRMPVFRLVFAASGRLLASVGRDGRALHSELMVWDVPSGRLVARLDEPSGRAISSVRFDPTGGFLWEFAIVADAQPRIRLWDLAARPGQRRLLWTREARSETPPLSADGALVALEEERQFVVRDVRGREVGRTGVLGVAGGFAVPTTDGSLLAIAGEFPGLVLWDLKQGRERPRLVHPGADPGRLSFSPDGRYLACTFRSGACVVHDLVRGASHTIPATVPDPDLNCRVSFAPDGRLIARNQRTIAGVAQPTEIWQLDPWRRIGRYPGHPESSESHAFVRGRQALVSSLGYEAVRWDYTAPVDEAQPAGHGDEAWSLAFTPDGNILASGSDDTDDRFTIRLWDTTSGRLVRGWYAGVGTVSALAFADEGRTLVSAHLGDPGDVRLWDPASGRLLATLSGHTDSVRTLAISPDGTLLASSGSDRTVRLWDLNTRRCLRVWDGHSDTVRFISFSPDGSRLATVANDRTVKIWDVAGGRVEARIPWLEKIAAVSFAPGGEQVATADEYGVITLWDVEDATRVQSIHGDDEELRCLVFSPDGEAIVTAGTSGTIRFWDPITAQELLTLGGHREQINALAFAPDGRTLASCSHDGVVRIWRAGDVRRGP